jgi:hypothetical protein
MVLSILLNARRNDRNYYVYILWMFDNCCCWFCEWVEYERINKKVRSDRDNMSNISELTFYKKHLSKINIGMCTGATRLLAGQVANRGFVSGMFVFSRTLTHTLEPFRFLSTDNVKVNLTLEQARKVQRGSIVVAVLFL